MFKNKKKTDDKVIDIRNSFKYREGGNAEDKKYYVAIAGTQPPVFTVVKETKN